MRQLDIVIAGAIAGIIAASGAHAADKDAKPEKCYGVVKAGKNDCQTSNTACAGSATKDGQKDAWLYLPKGTCEKIVGGSLKSQKS